MNKVKVSKQIAYLLRHDPSGLEVSREGFVDLYELVDRLSERWPQIDEDFIRRLVEEDPKGRYEIRNNRIRARYGHSIDVKPSLPEADTEKLYHGTTRRATEKILREGLKPKGRQKVHLSRTVSDAVEVGKRRTDDPVVLEVDAMGARGSGINIEKASERVFVADRIPPRFIRARKGGHRKK